jgi:hypothetical protein
MLSTSRKLGEVKIVQVQPSGLIYDLPRGSIYDPSRRVEVSRLRLTPQGVEGINSQGEAILDIHHADHPDTHNNGRNAISIGFTSHYRAMRARFGEHLQDGTAGENIIIDTQEEIWLADLGRKIEIKNQRTGSTVSLEVLRIAAPCSEFSHFAANSQERPLDAQALKQTLQFLGEGRRGFLLTLSSGKQSAIVQPGDSVFAVLE